jgi:DNA-binding response OmpR family regulator
MYTGKRILIVDDDQDVIMSFKVALEDYGFKVDGYNNPLLALSNFKPYSYDLLLIDIRMPNMTGFELSLKIRKADPDVKICFITAFDVYYKSLLEEYPNMDFDCFIKKPISAQALLQRIEIELSAV